MYFAVLSSLAAAVRRQRQRGHLRDRVAGLPLGHRVERGNCIQRLACSTLHPVGCGGLATRHAALGRASVVAVLPAMLQSRVGTWPSYAALHAGLGLHHTAVKGGQQLSWVATVVCML
jgi:hypothetical protein